VGAENFFLFGHDTDGVAEIWRRGYRPLDACASDPLLAEVLELVRSGFFSRGDTSLFRPLLDNLVYHDPYLVLADFSAYRECQQRVSAAYTDMDSWVRMSILNSARSGMFSSDRTIREYARDIWHARPVPVRLLSEEEVKVGFLQ
jgi:starch phosphorylase